MRTVSICVLVALASALTGCRINPRASDREPLASVHEASEPLASERSHAGDSAIVTPAAQRDFPSPDQSVAPEPVVVPATTPEALPKPPVIDAPVVVVDAVDQKPIDPQPSEPEAKPANAPANPPVVTSATAATSAATPALPTTPSLITGHISEEDFKRLHDDPTENAEPLHGEDLQIGMKRAYLSLPPAARAPLGGVLVIHEWWGLNGNIRRWSDRLAAEGYAALAIDLYDGVVATTREAALEAVKQVDERVALETMQAGLRFLQEDRRVLAPRRAALGWCFGGTQALRLALNAPDLDAVVMYYGNPITEAEALMPLRARLLGIFGSNDRSIPKTTVDEFQRALTAAGKDARILSYEAEHAFANPSNPRYDQVSAERAWSELLVFLRETLRKP